MKTAEEIIKEIGSIHFRYIGIPGGKVVYDEMYKVIDNALQNAYKEGWNDSAKEFSSYFEKDSK